MKNIKVTYLDDYKPLDYKIAKVDMKFNLDAVKTIVTTELHIKYNKQEKIFLNGENLRLLAITINKKKLRQGKDYVIDDTGLTLLCPMKEFKLVTRVEISPEKNKDLQGLYVSSDTLCSKCETEGFRRITYFPDRPDAMARYSVTIEADESKYPVLLSNGNFKSKKSLGNGRHQVVWNDPSRKSCYLFAIIAGKFDVLKDSFKTISGKKVKLGVYVEPGKTEYAKYALSCLKRAMKWDEDHFGCEYDLKYMNIVAIKDFNSGACENKGLNIFNDKYILVNEETATVNDYKNVDLIVAHEYFHNYSGNKITIRDWFNLALKEGLTVYREQKYAETFYDKDGAQLDQSNIMIGHQFKYDASSLAHPIVAKQYSNVRSIYNSTTYEKAAKVFKMLETLIGEAKFNKAIRSYFVKYKGKAVTYQELLKEAQKFTKIDMDKFGLWFDIVGNINIKITENYNADKNLYRLSIEHNKDRDLIMPFSLSLIVKGKEKYYDVVLDNSYKTFTFTDITSAPLLCLNPDFVAPVQVILHQSDDDYKNIIKFSKIALARHKAMQKYILNCIKDGGAGNGIEVIKSVINSKYLSDEVKAKMLSLPSVASISELFAERDFEKAFLLREDFLKTISKELKTSFEWLGQSKSVELRVLALNYLSYLDEYENEVVETYYKKSNMSEKLNAFVIITGKNFKAREDVINDFYETYKSHHLVVNKWFSGVAMSPLPDTLDRVKGLVKHKDFSFANPNNVYALLGSFASNNLVFHKKDGSGYDFFADCVIEVDKKNPQIACILLDFFAIYNNLPKNLADKINMSLEKIALKSSLLLKDKIKKINN